VNTLVNALPILQRKLLRDLRQIAGQAAAIVLVVACAVATAVMSFGVLRSLDQARALYYERCRFAELFVSLPRAPESAAEAIRRQSGVEGVQTRLVADVAVGLAGVDDPIAGHLLSLPERGEPEVNAIVLRRGRSVGAGVAPEVIVSESFAYAHGLAPGAPPERARGRPQPRDEHRGARALPRVRLCVGTGNDRAGRSPLRNPVDRAPRARKRARRERRVQ
jgi:putative ABC transport system permease protein